MGQKGRGGGVEISRQGVIQVITYLFILKRVPNWTKNLRPVEDFKLSSGEGKEMEEAEILVSILR